MQTTAEQPPKDGNPIVRENILRIGIVVISCFGSGVYQEFVRSQSLITFDRYDLGRVIGAGLGPVIVAYIVGWTLCFLSPRSFRRATRYSIFFIVLVSVTISLPRS